MPKQTRIQSILKLQTGGLGVSATQANLGEQTSSQDQTRPHQQYLHLVRIHLQLALVQLITSYRHWFKSSTSPLMIQGYTVVEKCVIHILVATQPKSPSDPTQQIHVDAKQYGRQHQPLWYSKGLEEEQVPQHDLLHPVGEEQVELM